MPNIVYLEYVSPRCVTCGRDLPHGRTRKCYDCLPPRRYKTAVPPRPDLPYTMDDRIAQAAAYGMSYGKFMTFIHNGWKLPPRIRPIRWPIGSAHAGEEA